MSSVPSESNQHTDTMMQRMPADVGAVLTRGAAAGLAGGLLFALANMWFSTAHGKPSVAPFLAISTIFHASAMPVMSQPDVITGLVLHLGLSLLFGIVFALIVTMLGLSTRPLLLLAAGLVYGLVLYIVNFQIIGRIFFPWFVNPKGPNQIFELWIHPIAFGLILVPFLLGFRASTRH
ncbi:MAG: hypothetical protein M3Y49_15025 [Actinomycetota bacterium]|nr:hypothetical protein [Actinomycetota bacterium]